MFSTIGLFAGRQQALIFYALAPLAVLCAVLVAPVLLRSRRAPRAARPRGRRGARRRRGAYAAG